MAPDQEPRQAPLLLHVFATFAIGGPQVRFVALAESFGLRYRHIVVAMDGDYACADRLPPGLDVRYERVEAPKGATVRNVSRFRRLLRILSPDLLVTYSWGSLEWAMANIPSLVRHIHVEDGFGPEERESQLARRVLMRRLVLARTIVVVPSRTLWRVATQKWKLNPRRVRYVPNGMRFAGQRIAATASEPIIGTVATLRPVKNLSRLVRAFRQVANVTPARLVIGGDGPERPDLEQLTAKLGLGGRVCFTGYLNDPMLLYGHLDIFALSSDTEQMPLSVIEAMASGLPVAATAVGDVKDMLAAQNQALVREPTDAALADAIATLARDSELRSSVGAANRARAEAEFSLSAMVLAWGALFDGGDDLP
jgi:glycosyltransferase involved in cell wall biosynthesis